MVCVAAFIILCLIGVFVFFLSFFKPDIGKRYLKIFKKAWACVGRRLTFRKCDTNFKEDIKNSILKKFIIKRPKLVKPISFGIEVLAVLIVFITIFSVVEAAKAGLSLYVLGTCNVSRPEACLFGEGNVCAIDSERMESNWFKDWVILFENIPDRMKKWNANDYLNNDSIYYKEFDTNKKTVLNIFGPMCHNCATSLKKQLNNGFFDKYNVALIPYATSEKSEFLARFMLAVNQMPLANEISPSWQLLKKLFTQEYQKHITWQDAFLDDIITESNMDQVMKDWLKELGYNDNQIEELFVIAYSSEIDKQILENIRIADEEIRIRGVPTTIYKGRRHTGVFKP